MAKLPKLTDLTDISGMVNKFKSMLEQFTGPAATDAIKAALEKEQDPKKVVLLEFDLLINQLQDLQIIQAKTINDMKNKSAELHKILELEQSEAVKQAEKTQPTSEKKTSE